MADHQVVTREEWLEKRRQLMAREKELTRARDELSRARRELPWVRVGEEYEFDTERGRKTLAELFGDRSQLVVYHFMFGPDWEDGCKSCSFWADHFNGITEHLAQRDVTTLAVSRAPLDKLLAFKKRMGWRFEWVSSHGSAFNYDFGVSFDPDQSDDETLNYNFGTIPFGAGEAPGVSVFYEDEDGTVYHTYPTYARGLDMLNGAYHYLDVVPTGRDEDDLPYPMAWLRLRDQYD